MEMKKENKYDTTRTVGNLQKFAGFFGGKSEVQKMKMKKENEYDILPEFAQFCVQFCRNSKSRRIAKLEQKLERKKLES